MSRSTSQRSEIRARGCRRLRPLAVLIATCALFLAAASVAAAAPALNYSRAQFYFDGRCGLLTTCETTTDWFWLMPESGKLEGGSTPIWLFARSRHSTCMKFSVSLEFAASPGTPMRIFEESAVRPGRTFDATTTVKNYHEQVRLHFYGSFPLGDPIIMPDCRRQHVVPPGNTLTDEGQLKYSVQVRVSHDDKPRWRQAYPNVHPAPQ
jgi:hypothetical protein